MLSKIIIKFLPFLVFIPTVVSTQTSSDKIRVGIIEFKEENQIGLENAGKIIAEWVASEFVRINKFEVADRLSLEEVVKEQALGQTGLLSDSTVAQVGKLHGVQGIVTGSIMQIGPAISITGKIIDVETGKVLKTSAVRASSIDVLPDEIEVLANQLCDISRAEFQIQKDLYKRKLSYLGIGGGLAANFSANDRDEENLFAPGLSLSGFYTTNRYSLWLHGVPLSSIKSLNFGASVDLNQFWGLAGEIGFISDDAIDFVQVNYFAGGIKIQPRHELSLKILFGGSLSGTLWLWDVNHSGGEKEEVDGFYKFIPPASYSIEGLYRISPRLTITAKIVSAGLENYELKEHADPLNNYYQGFTFSIGLLKEFPIGY